MKSDTQLRQDVIDELRWEPAVKEKEISVAARDGVVTLTGYVGSYAEKWAAERAVERVRGVQAVADDLKVRLPDESIRMDTEVAHRAIEALQWDVMVPDERVKVRVVDGWLTLEGDVEWAYQRDAAARVVRNLTGLRGITNDLAVKPLHVSTYDVATKIGDALRRYDEREASEIVIEAKDDVVTLLGRVPSVADRRVIETAAWNAPGVRSVRDEILVGV